MFTIKHNASFVFDEENIFCILAQSCQTTLNKCNQEYQTKQTLTYSGLSLIGGPVAIKLLQAWIFKSANPGLFLTSLVATSIVKFVMFMLYS